MLMARDRTRVTVNLIASRAIEGVAFLQDILFKSYRCGDRLEG